MEGGTSGRDRKGEHTLSCDLLPDPASQSCKAIHSFPKLTMSNGSAAEIPAMGLYKSRQVRGLPY